MSLIPKVLIPISAPVSLDVLAGPCVVAKLLTDNALVKANTTRRRRLMSCQGKGAKTMESGGNAWIVIPAQNFYHTLIMLTDAALRRIMS
jgi:hypothetical protein